ncbi:MAG: matrixin family metalloprotease [Candidatus Zixiibacteriota bacterium]
MLRLKTLIIFSIFLLLSYSTTSLGWVWLGVDWSYKPFPMGEDIEINPDADDPDCTPEAVVNAVWNGAIAWNSDADAGWEFTFGGTTTRNYVSYDGHNIIYFADESWGGVIAATYYWYSGSNMTEADIKFFDDGFNFSSQGNPTYSEMDVWAVAAHELGHVVGLGHSSDYNSTMYSTIAYGETKKRDLNADDIAGIHWIYSTTDVTADIRHDTPDYPEIVPSSGGNFYVDVRGTNNTGSTQTVRAKLEMRRPDGSWTTLWQRTNFRLNPYQTRSWNHLRRRLGASTQSGMYYYRVGGYETSYPYDKIDQTMVLVWKASSLFDIGELAQNQQVLEREGTSVLAPLDFELDQNYPNPFNIETAIDYQLPSDAYVNLSIYNINGQKIATLVEEYMSAGYYTTYWRGEDDFGNTVSSGVYFYHLEAGPHSVAKQMMLLK